jgi:uncharacterized coiled-coil protein SlyX
MTKTLNIRNSDDRATLMAKGFEWAVVVPRGEDIGRIVSKHASYDAAERAAGNRDLAIRRLDGTEIRLLDERIAHHTTRENEMINKFDDNGDKISKSQRIANLERKVALLEKNSEDANRYISDIWRVIKMTIENADALLKRVSELEKSKAP